MLNAKEEIRKLLEKGITLDDIKEYQEEEKFEFDNDDKNVYSDLRDYQKQVLDYTGNHLICNWSRTLGKTYTIASIIFAKKPKKTLYVSSQDISLLKYKLEEINDYSCKTYGTSINSIDLIRGKLVIKWRNGYKSEILNTSILKEVVKIQI